MKHPVFHLSLQISNDLPRSSGPNGRNALPGSAKKAADSLSLLEDDGADDEEYRLGRKRLLLG